MWQEAIAKKSPSLDEEDVISEPAAMLPSVKPPSTPLSKAFFILSCFILLQTILLSDMVIGAAAVVLRFAEWETFWGFTFNAVAVLAVLLTMGDTVLRIFAAFNGISRGAPSSRTTPLYLGVYRISFFLGFARVFLAAAAWYGAVQGSIDVIILKRRDLQLTESSMDLSDLSILIAMSVTELALLFVNEIFSRLLGISMMQVLRKQQLIAAEVQDGVLASETGEDVDLVS